MTNGEEGGVNQNKPPTDPPFSKQHPQDVFLGPGKPLLARRSRFTPPPAPPTDSQPAPAVPPAPSSTPTPSPQRLCHRHHVVKPLWPALFLFARLLRSSLSLRFAHLLHPFVLAHVVFTRFSALFQVGLKGAGGRAEEADKASGGSCCC